MSAGDGESEPCALQISACQALQYFLSAVQLSSLGAAADSILSGKLYLTLRSECNKQVQ